MLRTNIYLEERQAQALDERARAAGVSRAELIRRLLDEALAGSAEDVVADLAVLEAAFGIAADEIAPAGRAHDGRAAHLERVWQA